MRTRRLGVLVFFLGLGSQAVSGQSGIITTVAGNGAQGFAGDGGPAASASLNYPYGVAVDTSGNLFFTDFNNYRVRKVSANGVITTVAGNGTPGYSDYTGPATSASFSPHGVAVDASGNLFIADGDFRIRKVSASGIMTTFAGVGYEPVGLGDGGPATSAGLYLPWGVALDASGNLFITDQGNYRIRKVSVSGIITTVAGNGVMGFSGDGGPATSASFSALAGVAVDASGNLFVADTGNYRIRKVSVSGIITTVAGNGVLGFSGDGGPATSAALYDPDGVAVDTSGNLFIADTGNGRIRKVSASGIITTVAGGGAVLGDGGPATSASLYDPLDVAADASGNLFIADTLNNRIRKVSAPAPSGSPVAIPLPAAVNTVDVNPNTNQVYVGGNISNVVQNIVWIDGNTNSIVKSLGVGQGLHVNPATNKIYAADLYAGHILVYSGSDGSLLNTISAFGCPVEAVVDNQLNHIWGVGQCGGGNDPAFLIDGSTDTLISGYIGSGGVMGGFMAVNPSTHAFYMAVGGVEKEVNASTFAVTNAPFSASVIASSPLAASMYGADASGKNVVVINYGTESVVTTLPVSQTGAIAVNPTRNRVYAVDLSVSPPVIRVFAGGNSLIGSNTLIGSIPLRTGDQACCSMAVNSSSGTIYLPVVNSGSPFLLVIDDTLTSNPPVSAPVLTSLSPSTAVAGTGALTVTANGSGFVSGSVVQWNGAALTTTFVSATQLTAAVPAGDIASVGVAQVNVNNPGLPTSNLLSFTIQASAGPSITSIAPSSASVGGGAFTLTVNGAGFSASLNSLQGPVPGSVVQWNGTALQTTFISSSQLTAAVPVIDLGSAGVAQVTVANGASTTSNALTFTIQPPSTLNGPAITSLSPPSVAPSGLGTGIGVEFLPLVVTGSGFEPASVVRWNGTDQQTTFVSPTQLEALIADDEIPGSPTAVLVTVFNPAPGGGISNSFSYPIDPSAAPVISSLSPSSVTTGAAFQLTINGWNFSSGAVVRWNGSDRPTTPFFDPHGQCCVLYAAIAASDVAAAGTAQVTVFTAGAGSSNPLTFTIQAPQTTGPTITAVSNAATHTPGVIAPNSWVEIKGSNLAPAGDSRIWQGSDFVNHRMPTQLDGVGVTMNGENAYVYYISPAQVNVLTPPDLASGTVQVNVTTGGATSAAFTAQAQEYLPSFFMFGPGPYVLGTHATNGSDLGPTSLYPGQTTPAAPGELVVLYATGFGPISPPVVAGSEVQSGSLPALPLVQIGGIPASVAFAGLASPGLYQFNVFVPTSAPNGDNALTAQYSGLTTQSGVLLTVQNPNSGVNPTLTITTSGTGSGAVGSSPAGTSCGSGCLSFAAGTVVALTATANTGSTFAGWSGACSGTGSCSVTMNSNQAVTAAFNLSATVNPTLNITTTGTGSGTVSASPTGTSCGSGCLSFAAGTLVTLTATPNTGSTFAGWSGACSGTGSCGVTMNSNQAVTASFNSVNGSPFSITSLSTPQANLLDSLTINGTGFNPTNAAISVIFIPRDGNPSVSIPVSAASATTLQVGVPPFIDPTTLSFVSRAVDIEVIQVSGTTVTTSNRLSGFTINALPPVPAGVPAGALTAAFLSAGLNISANVQAAVGGDPSFSNLGAALAVLDSGSNALLSIVNVIVNNPNVTVIVPLADGTSTTLSAKELALSDQLVQAIVASLASHMPASVSPTALARGALAATGPSNCPTTNGASVFSTQLCTVQAYFGNLARNLISDPDTIRAEKQLAAELTVGIAAHLGCGLTGLAFAPAGPAAIAVALGCEISLAPIVPIISSFVGTGEAPDGVDLVAGLATGYWELIAEEGFPVTSLLYNAGKVLYQASKVAPPANNLGDAIVSSYPGGVALVMPNGVQLLRVPDNQGSFDSTTLVLSPQPALPPPAPYALTVCAGYFDDSSSNVNNWGWVFVTTNNLISGWLNTVLKAGQTCASAGVCSVGSYGVNSCN